MRFKKIIIFCLAMLMASVFIVSCGGGGDGEEGAERVYVGLTGPLSGIGGGYGKDIKAGLDMAIDEINGEGGVNIGGQDYIFVLKSADDMVIPEKAMANAQSFVLEDGINIIFNPVTNTITSLMDINTTPGEEFLLMTYTSVPNYIEKPNPLMVQGPPPFEIYIPEYVEMSMGQGWSKVAFLQTSEQYGVEWADAFKEAWTAAGGSVVGDAPSNYYTETDFTPYITKVMTGQPDAIFCGGPSEPTALLIEQARNLGFTGGFICIDQSKLDSMIDIIGSEKLDKTLAVLPVDQSDVPYMPTFMQEYEEQYGKRVTWETAINYCMFYMLVDSMKIAGSVDDIQAVRAAFAENSTTSGDRFPLEFSGIDDATGQLYMPGVVGIYINGQYNAQPTLEWWKL